MREYTFSNDVDDVLDFSPDSDNYRLANDELADEDELDNDWTDWLPAVGMALVTLLVVYALAGMGWWTFRTALHSSVEYQLAGAGVERLEPGASVAMGGVEAGTVPGKLTGTTLPPRIHTGEDFQFAGINVPSASVPSASVPSANVPSASDLLPADSEGGIRELLQTLGVGLLVASVVGLIPSVLHAANAMMKFFLMVILVSALLAVVVYTLHYYAGVQWTYFVAPKFFCKGFRSVY